MSVASARSRAAARTRRRGRGLAEGLELLAELPAVRDELALEALHLAPPAPNLGGQLDEVAPELEPAPHLAGREGLDRQARPRGGPFAPDLLAAAGDALLLARQELQALPGLVQAGLGRGLLGDAFDLAAEPIRLQVGLVLESLEASRPAASARRPGA